MRQQFGKTYFGWMVLLLIILQNIPTRTPKLEAHIKIRG
jgi:hypothetical protein